MSADQSFQFGSYTLRPAGTSDIALAVEWTSADAYHATTTPPDFWIEQRTGRDSYVLEDAEGPVFFFKLHRLAISAVELHCQFPPQDDEHMRERITFGIMRGFAWLEGALKVSKVDRIFFDSRYPPLRRFAVRRLGFIATNGHDTLIKELDNVRSF